MPVSNSCRDNDQDIEKKGIADSYGRNLLVCYLLSYLVSVQLVRVLQRWQIKLGTCFCTLRLDMVPQKIFASRFRGFVLARA